MVVLLWNDHSRSPQETTGFQGQLPLPVEERGGSTATGQPLEMYMETQAKIGSFDVATSNCLGEGGNEPIWNKLNRVASLTHTPVCDWPGTGSLESASAVACFKVGLNSISYW